jgi:hypothetical protein
MANKKRGIYVYMLHAVLFRKSMYSAYDAVIWLNYHRITPIKKMHETTNYYRFRITPPIAGHYYTKEIQPGLLFVMRE